MSFSVTDDYHDYTDPTDPAEGRDTGGGTSGPNVPDLPGFNGIDARSYFSGNDGGESLGGGPGLPGLDSGPGLPGLDSGLERTLLDRARAQQGLSLPTDNAVGGPATARAGWDPNWGPPPGGSRTGTANGIDLTSSLGQPNQVTGNIYTPPDLPGSPFGGVNGTFPHRLDTIQPGPPGASIAGYSPPAGAGGGPAGSGGPSPGGGQLSNAQWEQQFRQANGYFDPVFNSRENFLRQAQIGDTAIRGATGGGDQLARMAAFDSDARRIYGGIQAVGEQKFYGSQMGADWAGIHNGILAQQAQGLGAGGGNQQGTPQQQNGSLTGAVTHAAATGNQGMLDWLKSQTVNVPANPMANSDAMGLQTQMYKDLDILGAHVLTAAEQRARGITPGTDIYYNPPSGGLGVIYGDGGVSGVNKIALADWVDKAAQLHASAEAKRQQAAAAAAPPQGNGYGGGYGNNQRSGYPAQSRVATGGGGGGGIVPYRQPSITDDTTSVTPVTGITGAAYGTNRYGETLVGPNPKALAPSYDEFGRPFGAGYGR